MPSGLVYLRPMRVAFLRSDGADRATAVQAWQEMYALLDKLGVLREVERGYGLIRGHRLIADGDKPQPESYEAAVEHMPSLVISPATGLQLKTLPGGSYLRRRVTAGPEAVSGAFTELCQEANANPDINLDVRRPLVEIYFSKAPKETDPRRIDICAPVVPRVGTKGIGAAA